MKTKTNKQKAPMPVGSGDFHEKAVKVFFTLFFGGT
jgi:hypothetical protein